jgi:hypothetical protein
VAELEEARSLDVDDFHDMIRTARDDQILKVLFRETANDLSIMNIYPSDTWGAKYPAFGSHYCTASGILVVELGCLLFLIVIFTAYNTAGTGLFTEPENGW